MILKNPEIRTRARIPAGLLRRPVPAQSLRLAAPSPMPRLTDMSPCRPTRREFLIGAGALLVLAPYGCGSEDESGGGGETTAGETRTIEHELGTTEAPAEPQRVFLLEPPTIDAALTLGVEPVGVSISQSESYPYIQRRLPGNAENVGEPTNIEAVATLEPDLIVGLGISLEEIYEELSEIALTVGVDFGESSANWKHFGRGVAGALGRVEEFESGLSAYEERAGEIGRRLGVPGEAPTVAILLIVDEGTFLRFELPGIFSGSVVYDDVGLPLPPGLREPAEAGEFILEVSQEQFSRSDADELFISSIGTEPEQQIEEVRQDPLFQNLRAVESGNVYPVGAHWFSGNLFAANLILDDIERYLLGEGSTGGGETS